jgi:hypothetical protein
MCGTTVRCFDAKRYVERPGEASADLDIYLKGGSVSQRWAALACVAVAKVAKGQASNYMIAGWSN